MVESRAVKTSSQQKAKRSLSVAVFLNRRSKGSRDQAAGVFRFASEHDDWEIHLYSRPDTPADLKKLAASMISRPDGIISGGMSVVETLRKRFGRRIPAVLLDVHNPSGRTDADGYVLCDDHAVGKRAAEFLLSRGYTAFAFAGIDDTPFGDPDMFNSQNRENGFRRELEKAGMTLSVYREKPLPGGCHYSGDEELGSWLHSLPKPCALLACSDTIAQSVLDCCRQRRIGVPQQIAVLGIENEPSVCENTKPTLSSIEPDYSGGGYISAVLLDRIMRDPADARSARRAKYGVAGLSERMSTSSMCGQMRRVSRALETIRLRALSGLTVRQLADEMGITVRSLEKAFQDACGGTVRDAILKVRLAEARRLAKRTRLRVDEIARSCGFRTGSALKALFKRYFGLSVRECRKSQ